MCVWLLSGGMLPWCTWTPAPMPGPANAKGKSKKLGVCREKGLGGRVEKRV